MIIRPSGLPGVSKFSPSSCCLIHGYRPTFIDRNRQVCSWFQQNRAIKQDITIVPERPNRALKRLLVDLYIMVGRLETRDHNGVGPDIKTFPVNNDNDRRPLG